MTDKAAAQKYPGDEIISTLRGVYRLLNNAADSGVTELRPRGVILGLREVHEIEKRQFVLNQIYRRTDQGTHPGNWTFRGDPLFLANCDSVVGIAFAGDFDEE